MVTDFLKKVMFWFYNARLFSLPMTVMSWLVVFLYALKHGGGILNGILALVGIAFAHLATNLFDDYVDYKKLSVSPDFMNSTVKSKCAYIKSGEATLKDLLTVVIIYCTIASLTGLILWLRSGIGVLWLGLLGGLIVLSYAKLSSRGLSELAVGTAFGPLLFEGVYYVMTGSFSFDVFILSIAVVIFTVVLLYVHTFLDYDGDVISHKKTLCCRIGEKFGKIWALNFYVLLCSVSYILMTVLAFVEKKPYYLIVFLSLPFVIFLYESLKKYMNGDNSIKVRWWNYPLDNWERIEKEGTQAFYFNLLGARNLAMWFQILVAIAVVL